MNDFPWSRGEPPYEGPAPPPPRDRLPFHPLAATFPLLDRASPEFRGLVESIRETGSCTRARFSTVAIGSSRAKRPVSSRALSSSTTPR
jgi:hypothetical protein